MGWASSPGALESFEFCMREKEQGQQSPLRQRVKGPGGGEGGSCSRPALGNKDKAEQRGTSSPSPSSPSAQKAGAAGHLSGLAKTTSEGETRAAVGMADSRSLTWCSAVALPEEDSFLTKRWLTAASSAWRLSENGLRWGVDCLRPWGPFSACRTGIGGEAHHGQPLPGPRKAATSGTKSFSLRSASATKGS